MTHAGNPVLSTPDGREMDRALASLEFMASIDFYINETTRHAHIILPPTGPLERGHYDIAFHLFGSAQHRQILAGRCLKQMVRHAARVANLS